MTSEGERTCPDCGGSLHTPGDVRLGTHREWRDCIEHFKRALPEAERKLTDERKSAAVFRGAALEQISAADAKLTAAEQLAASERDRAERAEAERDNAEGLALENAAKLGRAQSRIAELQGELDRVRTERDNLAFLHISPAQSAPAEESAPAVLVKMPTVPWGGPPRTLPLPGDPYERAGMGDPSGVDATAEQPAPVKTCASCGHEWTADTLWCPRCAEQPAPAGTGGVECPECGGNGLVAHRIGATVRGHVCPTCRGTGRADAGKP